MASIVDKQGNIAFFGQLSWGNFFDWLVTLCLGGIIMLTVVHLGGVRPDTHLALLPLYVILLVLHGIWLAVNKESPRRLSQIPMWFVPGLLWMLCSVLWFSPVQWLGWYEMIYALEAFVLLWVLSNNVRSRAHLWLLIIMSMVPAAPAVFNGFYQFFQDPSNMVGALTEFELVLNSEFFGRSTGVFADPNSFAAFLLILLPSLLIAAAVSRLPMILRLLCFYVATMFLAAITFTQAYWAVALVVAVFAVVPWFCFRKFKRRFRYSFIGVLIALLIFVSMAVFHPLFQKGIKRALSEDGEGVRLVLWGEALRMAAKHPITGVGAGAYGVAFQQSSRVSLADAPQTPHNDYLLILSQLGVLGVLFFGVPSLFVFFKAWGQWRKEPFAVKLRDSDETIMPPQRFFLSIGLVGAAAFGMCLATTFVFYVPGLTLYGLLMFSILMKASFNRKIMLPEKWGFSLGYILLTCVLGSAFYFVSSPKLEGQALELRARQQLDHLIKMRVHVSGNEQLLDEVITLYEAATEADPRNADAWLGLSSSICQLYFRNPSKFEDAAALAVECATRAQEISPLYWKAWAQLGVARSFNSESKLAEEAFIRALEIAPRSSNAHYYYAAFLSANKSRLDVALSSVRRALEINPNNSAARRLEQKLQIL